MRCRTLDECRKILEGGGMVLAAFEIDDSWTSSDGLIDDPRLHRPQMSHSVALIASDEANETLRFGHKLGSLLGRRRLRLPALPGTGLTGCSRPGSPTSARPPSSQRRPPANSSSSRGMHRITGATRST